MRNSQEWVKLRLQVFKYTAVNCIRSYLAFRRRRNTRRTELVNAKGRNIALIMNRDFLTEISHPAYATSLKSFQML